MKRYPSQILLVWIAVLFFACIAVELTIVFGYTEKGLLHKILYVWASLLLAAALVDRYLARNPPPVAVTRDIPPALAQAQWNEVKLQITNHGAQPLQLDITDLVDASAETEGNDQQISLAPQQTVSCHYQLRCCERGNLEFGNTQLRIASPFRLWHCSTTAATTGTVRVFPAFSRVDQFEELVKSHQTMMLGLRKRPKRGDGTDFHQLRDYQRDDEMRKIDWKASVRRGKLVAREYQEERDQQIIFMLDCSRHMRTKDDELSHFDHALNAMLLLSHIALRQGDAVGVLAFGNGTVRWQPPHKGQNTLNKLINVVYDLQPGQHAADYSEAVMHLMQRQKRRCLVVLISNLHSEDISELVAPLKLLKQQHLALIACLREELLEAAHDSELNILEDALTYVAAEDFLTRRQHGIRRLQQQGMLTIDASPANLPPALINRYFDIKRAALL